MPAPPELLRQVEIFESVSDRDLERLARSFKQSTFNEGAVIATEHKKPTVKVRELRALLWRWHELDDDGQDVLHEVLAGRARRVGGAEA